MGCACEQEIKAAARNAPPPRTAMATCATGPAPGGCGPPEVSPAYADSLPMTSRALRARLDAIEAKISPPLRPRYTVSIRGEPEPPGPPPDLIVRFLLPHEIDDDHARTQGPA